MIKCVNAVMRRCADNGHITRGLIITVVYLFTFNVCLNLLQEAFYSVSLEFLSGYSLRRRSHKKQQPNLKKDFPKNAEQNLSRP